MLQTNKNDFILIKAISLDANWRLFLENPFQARLHSIFKRAVNLTLPNEEQTLLTLVSAELDNAPNSIRCDILDWLNPIHHQLNHQLNNLNHIHRLSTLNAGDLVTFKIDLSHAINCHFQLPSLFELSNNQFSLQIKSQINFNLNWVQNKIKYHPLLILNPLFFDLAALKNENEYKDENKFNDKYQKNILNQALFKRSNDLCQSLLNFHSNEIVDENSIYKNAIHLIGLGSGLTPSGDDFLVGLFTALRIFHPYYFDHANDSDHLNNFNHLEDLKKSRTKIINRFIKKVTQTAKTQTNAISFAAIEQASIGRLREKIENFCDAFINDQSKEKELLNSALENILSIGSSSGADLLCGILAGFQIEMLRDFD